MVYAIIMAGGSGTRFWPESRRARPKQFLTIARDRSMIRATVERIVPEIHFQRIMVVSGASHLDEIRCQIPELNDNMIIAEPRGLNTGPCIALAAFRLHKTDPEAIMVVLPADHLIRKEQEFREAVRAGVEVVSQGNYLLTFGIVPNRPETGYGYIKLGNRKLEVKSTAIYQVDRFEEKPDLTTANKYVASGQYMWNSGIFIWKAADIIQGFDRYLPSLSNTMREISPVLGTPEESEALSRAYQTIQAISIDYGILEKADNVLCIPVDVDWNDVGSWASIGDVWEHSDNGNAVKGDTVLLESSRCIVSSPHKLTTLIGIDDLIVVDTPDALMICHKDKAQDVRILREILKKLGYDHLL